LRVLRIAAAYSSLRFSSGNIECNRSTSTAPTLIWFFGSW
jgi:hypothetical protein